MYSHCTKDYKSTQPSTANWLSITTWSQLHVNTLHNTSVALACYMHQWHIGSAMLMQWMQLATDKLATTAKHLLLIRPNWQHCNVA
jgi:hypothetical protein